MGKHIRSGEDGSENVWSKADKNGESAEVLVASSVDSLPSGCWEVPCTGAAILSDLLLVMMSLRADSGDVTMVVSVALWGVQKFKPRNCLFIC